MANRQDTARRIRDHVQSAAARERNTIRTTVVKLNPLTVEDPNGSLLEVDDDFDLSSWGRLYHRTIGLRAGDTMLLQKDDAHYVTLDVLSDATDSEIDQIGSASLQIGTVSTGAAGSSAAASITGKPRKLNLTIPRGATGATGPAGTAGTPGTPGAPGTAGASVPFPIIRTTAASWSGTFTAPRTGTMFFWFGGTCYGAAAGFFIALDLVIDGTYADNAFVFDNQGAVHKTVVCFHSRTVAAGTHSIAIGPSSGFTNTLTDTSDELWITAILF